MGETRKLAAILVSDVVGYSRLTSVDEDRTLARLRALRSDLIDPTISVHHGRIVKRTGDGSVIEFLAASLTRCRCCNRGSERHGRTQRARSRSTSGSNFASKAFIWATSLKESDGDLMGDGVNIAARGWKACAGRELICLSRGRISSSQGGGSISRSAISALPN